MIIKCKYHKYVCECNSSNYKKKVDLEVIPNWKFGSIVCVSMLVIGLFTMTRLVIFGL
jgi:hypothetical protein